MRGHWAADCAAIKQGTDQMKLDKKTLREIRAQLEIAFENINNFTDLSSTVLNGIELSLGNCSFNEDNATFKLNVKVAGSKSEELKSLEFFANLYNLDLSKIAASNSKRFSLVGYNGKARTYPFIMQDLGTGSKYKCSESEAKRMFAKAVQNA